MLGKLRRICSKCGTYFTPNGKHSKVCDACRLKQLKIIHEMHKKKHKNNIKKLIKYDILKPFW